MFFIVTIENNDLLKVEKTKLFKYLDVAKIYSEYLTKTYPDINNLIYKINFTDMCLSELNPHDKLQIDINSIINIERKNIIIKNSYDKILQEHKIKSEQNLEKYF